MKHWAAQKAAGNQPSGGLSGWACAYFNVEIIKVTEGMFFWFYLVVFGQSPRKYHH